MTKRIVRLFSALTIGIMLTSGLTQASSCMCDDTPIVVNPEVAADEPLLLRFGNFRYPPTFFHWRWQWKAGGKTVSIKPKFLSDSDTMLVIWLPKRTSAATGVIRLSRGNGPKTFCEGADSFELPIRLSEKKRIHSPEMSWRIVKATGGLYNSFQLAANMPVVVANGPLLLHIEGEVPAGKKMLRRIVIDTALAQNYTDKVFHFTYDCENEGIELLSGGNYRAFILQYRNNRLVAIQGWRFSVPSPPILNPEEQKKFDAEFKEALLLSEKCNQNMSDESKRSLCVEIQKNYARLQYQEQINKGLSFDHDASALNVVEFTPTELKNKENECQD